MVVLKSLWPKKLALTHLAPYWLEGNDPYLSEERNYRLPDRGVHMVSITMQKWGKMTENTTQEK